MILMLPRVHAVVSFRRISDLPFSCPPVIGKRPLRILGTGDVVTLQFRVVPYVYPELFPTFYLVCPRSFRLIPDVYKNTEPEAALQEGGDQRRDDPRKVGWSVDQSFARVHFCQLEEVWNRRPLNERRLGWALGSLLGLLRNPLNIPYETAKAS